MFMFVNFKPLTYNKTYTYPAWAQGMGMCLAFSSMICIPAYFCIQMLITPGSIKQVSELEHYTGLTIIGSTTLSGAKCGGNGSASNLALFSYYHIPNFN